jgi:hypothetical protein
LVTQGQSAAATVAQAADQQGRQQRRLDLVPDRISDRHVQRLAVEVVVEGVAADGAGGFQPTGEGELAGLAGVGREKPGRSRRWISAASEKGVVRWPHSNRSVWRRLAMTT